MTSVQYLSLSVAIDGFAFSQEEGATVTQTDIIRAYDTTQPKPDGV